MIIHDSQVSFVTIAWRGKGKAVQGQIERDNSLNRDWSRSGLAISNQNNQLLF